jgi:hypothetical protein
LAEVSTAERSDVVERAMRYPYPAPSRPFVQLGRRTLEPGEVEVDWSERLAVLAYGSNAAPEALGHKLAISSEPVLVAPALLQDFDVVYSAHISPYGAVPATLQYSPGVSARVHVTYMTDGQLDLVSATEPNYEPVGLDGIDCRLESGEEISRPSAFVSRHGCLLIDGHEVALTAIEATGRTLAELGEPEVLEYVRAAIAPTEPIEEFVLANVTDPALAQSRSARLPRSELRRS